ncbi:MAG: nucleoside phosphorylase [Nanoarchaeota archaeon]|nr:nucleoside phosphorylase [Nanoarchaeota archaeon]
MSYPQFKNKHLEEALFGPADFIKYKNLKGNFPTKYILVYSMKAFNYFKRKYHPKKIMELNSLNNIYKYKDTGFMIMKGIGSPNAAAIFEELIILGGKTFLNIGFAGGLKEDGIFLCNKALRDEGTSYHYLPHGCFVYPDENLTKKLGKSINQVGLNYKEGSTWTLDAPYRETKAEIECYAKKGISTVEMETSALFAVAKYRKVKIAAAFVVSDVLEKEWIPKFDKKEVRRNLNLLIDAGVNCLEELK